MRSKFGSVVYEFGEFYNSRWESVFIPLTEAEAKRFLDRVQAQEIKLNRRLNSAELIQIVREVGV